MKLNKHTRAAQHGTRIECPKCGDHSIVYHFAWSAVTCQNCNDMVDKEDWTFVGHLTAPAPQYRKRTCIACGIDFAPATRAQNCCSNECRVFERTWRAS